MREGRYTRAEPTCLNTSHSAVGCTLIGINAGSTDVGASRHQRDRSTFARDPQSASDASFRTRAAFASAAGALSSSICRWSAWLWRPSSPIRRDEVGYSTNLKWFRRLAREVKVAVGKPGGRSWPWVCERRRTPRVAQSAVIAGLRVGPRHGNPAVSYAGCRG